MTSRKNSKRPAPENECDRSRQRRRRTAFTDEQLDRLEDSFENEKFPGIQIREDLARELGIGEARIQVWFQNRRARWRKREIKNKPAPALPAAKPLPGNSDVIPPAMFHPSPAIFPLLNQTCFRPWSPFYPPFATSVALLPPRSTLGPGPFNRDTTFPCAATQTVFNRDTTFSCAATQTVFNRDTTFPCAATQTVFNRNTTFPCDATQPVSVMVRPRLSASASPPFSPSTSPIANPMTQYQASYDSDSGESRHSADDYLAAATLASGFQREN
ncbi:hypothetical protein OS493_035206 [Desmophyllum pertusum]|uniref:Homeobox domain-containing protein n=1 Tax=Desmophyllum pertusum TaxID=174260 RepID=A0A9W9ZVX3_9CNID|nr:hypothetical protein OS493_035206 [Desmophyllum pertusum]